MIVENGIITESLGLPYQNVLGIIFGTVDGGITEPKFVWNSFGNLFVSNGAFGVCLGSYMFLFRWFCLCLPENKQGKEDRGRRAKDSSLSHPWEQT